MEIAVRNKEGKDTGRKVSLNEAVFAIKPNDHAIYLDVKHIMANRRQGTHKAKQRNEISGSTKKLRKQKGTGHARVGGIKNPLFRGGGRVFGPQPRDYEVRLTRKLRLLARRSALSHKVKSNRLHVIEDFDLAAPKTKEVTGLLEKLSLAGNKTLFVFATPAPNVVLASRNLQGTKVIRAAEINTYDILNAGDVVMAESSVTEISKLLGGK